MLLRLLCAVGVALGSCAPAPQPGEPISSRTQAIARAKAHLGTLAFEGLKVDAARRGENWLVTTRRGKAEGPVSVLINAETGEVTRYAGVSYSVELAPSK